MLRVLNPMRAITPRDLNRMVDKSVSYVQALNGTVNLLNAGIGASGAGPSGFCLGNFVADPDSGTPEALVAAEGVVESVEYHDAKSSKHGAKNRRARQNRQALVVLGRAQTKAEYNPGT